MFGSLVILRELMNTTKQTQRDYLIVDYQALEPIPKDEKLLGFYMQTDQYGGCITNPMFSDVQDEALREELTRRGLDLRDAEHITQAVCNGCGVFLTRDERTIINPHRAWLETRFPTFKVQQPSELLAELGHSATSMVGGVSLGFAVGYDQFTDILRGAREMDLNACGPAAAANLSLLAALLGLWNRTFLGYPTVAVLPYSQALVRFAAHLQQLDMESNGKGIDREGRFVTYPTGPIVWGEPGTNGQHAFYQLIHQGTTPVPCEFIGMRQTQYGLDLTVQDTTSQQKLLANLLAQSIGLATGQRSGNPNKTFPGNRPNSVLIADRLTPRALGALLAYFENKVAFQGLIWNVNSFDQEGVQLGKVLANQLIGHLAKDAGAPEEDDPVGWAMLRAAGVV